MNIVAFMDSKQGISSVISSINKDSTATDLLKWLVFSSSTATPTRTGASWCLSRLTDAVLSKLPLSVTKELSNSPHKAKYGSFKLYLVPDKVFSVNLNGSEMSIYDLGQYFPEDEEPETVKDLQEKANRLSQALKDIGVPKPMTLASPIAALGVSADLQNAHRTPPGGNQDGVTAKEVSVYPPTIWDALSGVGEARNENVLGGDVLDAYEMALQCTPREWSTNYQVGYFQRLHSADLSSAYPAIAADLVDLRDCMFVESDDLDTWKDALYGCLEGDFTVYPDHPLAFCSPFLADRGDGVLTNFVGVKKDHGCMLDEVKTLLEYGMGEFKLKKGWFIIPGVEEGKERYPFKEFMGRLFGKRGGNGDLVSYFLKRVMNGVVGKLLEVRKDDKGNVLEYGELYNPIYHAIITSRCRLNVFEFLEKNGIMPEELVAVTVDGVRTTRKIDLPDRAGMGEWRYKECESAFVLSPGAVISESRNFKKTTLNEMLKQVKDHPEARIYGKKRDINLKTIRMSQTREFKSLPRNGRDLMENRYLSEPTELANSRLP